MFFVCHASSPERRAFEGCIVRTSIALPFIGRFGRGFQRFFHQCFKFDVLRFTGYGVIAEKPRVGQLGRIFPCTLYENYALDRKMNDAFFDGLDELYHHVKFGEDRTTRRL